MANSLEELQPEGVAELALLCSGYLLTETSETSSFFDVSDLTASDCPAECCSNMSEAHQPKQMDVFKDLTKKGRNSMVSLYNKYPWITLCLTKKKVFCITVATHMYTKLFILHYVQRRFFLTKATII